MLAIPPKMQNALDSGIFEPVKTVKIVTSVLDAPVITNQTFVDVSGNLSNVAQKRNIEQAYPDPSATGAWVDELPLITVATKRSYSTAYNKYEYENGRRDLGVYITVETGEDIQQASSIDSIVFKLSRINSNSQVGWILKCRVYQLNDKGEVVNSAGEKPRGSNYLAESETTYALETLGVQYAGVAEYEFFFRSNLIGFNPGARIVLGMIMQPINGTVLEASGFNSAGFIWWSTEILPASGLRGLGSIEPSPNGDSLKSFNPIFGDLTPSVRINMLSYDSTPSPTLQIQFDVGETPTKTGSWSIQDTPAAMINPISGNREETSISYNAWAGNTLGAKTVNLGAIDPSDIASLTITTLRQYYVLEGVFASTPNGLRTHQFNAANPVFPKDTLLISNKKLPFPSDVALGKTSSISTSLDIKTRLTKRGDFSFDVFDIDGVIRRNLIQSHLINLPTEYRLGHYPNATSEDDLLLLFSGKLSDIPKHKKGILSFKAQDYSTDLDVKIPRVDTGKLNIDRTKIRRTTKGDTLVNTMLKIIGPESRILSRYVRRPTFTALEAHLKASDVKTLWISAKVFKEETEARKELQYLLEITGAYLVPQEDGVLSIIIFPRLDTPVAIWDDSVIGIGDFQKSGLKKTIVNLCFVEYDLYGDGELSGLIGSNDRAAQNDLAPGAEQHLADRIISTGGYLGDEQSFNGKTLGGRIANREVSHKKYGIIPYACETGLNQIAVQVGDFISLTTDVYIRKGVLGADRVNFMPTRKTILEDEGKIAWDLAEAISVGNDPTAIFTAAPTIGLPTLNVQIDASASHDNNPSAIPIGSLIKIEVDWDYNGRNFIATYTDDVLPLTMTANNNYGSTSVGIKRIAVRVTNSIGGEHIATTGQAGMPPDIRVLGVPFASISVLYADPNLPSIAQLRSISNGVTGTIILIEWDIGHDGVTFIADEVGETISIPLLPSALLVALRATDEDGNTTIATVTLPASAKAITPGVDVISILTSQWRDLVQPKARRVRALVARGRTILGVGDPGGDPDAYIIKSLDGEGWLEKPNPRGAFLSGIADNGATTISVGASHGSGAYIISSTNLGESWIDRPNPQNLNLYDIASKGDLFCAVGQNDGTRPYVVTSLNQGVSWAQQTAGLSVNQQLNGVTRHKDRLITVGNHDGTHGSIYTSDNDGITWIRRLNGVAATLFDVASDGDRVVVAVGVSIGVGPVTILRSEDSGDTWSLQPTTVFGQLNSVIFNGYIFLACGWRDSGITGYISGSRDGKTWWTRDTGVASLSQFDCGVWNGAKFVASGFKNPGTQLLMSSLSMIN